MDLQLKLFRETFTFLDVLYGREAHLYGLQVRKDKAEKDATGCYKRKDFGNHENGRNHQSQGGFKKHKANVNF